MSALDRNKIKEVLRPLVKSSYESQKDSDSDLYRNTIDVFAAVIETTIKDISMEEWMKQEKQRQIQKTLQNKIGDLHQNILGTITGVKNLGTGSVIDLEGPGFIAEVKNKHNTTKGNNKKSIYDDIKKKLPKDGKTIGYYVEILPPNGKSYDEHFTPSDNTDKTKREKNDLIRKIDGKTFYKKITNDSNSLRDLYHLLPILTSEILDEEYGEKRNPVKYINDKEFSRVYGED